MPDSIKCSKCDQEFTDEEAHKVHMNIDHGASEADLIQLSDDYSVPNGIGGYNPNPNSDFYNNKIFRKGSSTERTSILGEAVANEVPFSGLTGHDSTWTWTCPKCSQPIQFNEIGFNENILDHLKSHGYSDEKVRAILSEDVINQTIMDNILKESYASETIDRDIYILLRTLKRAGNQIVFHKSFGIDDKTIKDAELLGLVFSDSEGNVSLTPEGVATLERQIWFDPRLRYYTIRDDIMGTPVAGEAVANEVPYAGIDKNSTLTWTCPTCLKRIPWKTMWSSRDMENIASDHLKSHGYSNEEINYIMDIEYQYLDNIIKNLPIRNDRIVGEAVANEYSAKFERSAGSMKIGGKPVKKIWESFQGWYWYGIEDQGDGTWYGYVQGFENEWGYFSEDEIKSLGSMAWEVPKSNWEWTGRSDSFESYASEKRISNIEVQEKWWQMMSERGASTEIMSEAGVDYPANSPEYMHGDPVIWNEEFSSNDRQKIINYAGGIDGMKEDLVNDGWITEREAGWESKASEKSGYYTFEAEDDDVDYDKEDKQTVGFIEKQHTEPKKDNNKELDDVDISEESIDYVYPTKASEARKRSYTTEAKMVEGLEEEYDDFKDSDEEEVTETVTLRKLHGFSNESIARELHIIYGVPHEEALEKVHSIEVSTNDKVAQTFFGKMYKECNESEKAELRMYSGSD